MKVSQLRNKMGEQLLERRKESFDKNEGGLKFSSIINEDLGVKEWCAKEGDHLIDILPYVAGAGNPERKIKTGDISDHATYYVHKNVGSNDIQVVCPAANYNKPCPICEYAKECRENGDETTWKALRPKRVTLYNVIVYDNDKEEAKGVQVWAVAHWNMERHLNVLAQKPRGGGKVLFSHPDQGKSIWFKRTGAGKDNTQYLGHKFEDRDYVIPDELLDATYCLEEIVNRADYDEIAEAFFGNKHKKEESVNTETGEVTEERPTSVRRPKLVTKTVTKNLECFGISTDEIEECGDCESYNECAKQYEINKDNENVTVDAPEPVSQPEPEKPKSLRGRLNRR